MSLVNSPFFLSQGVTADVAGQSLRFEEDDSAYLSRTPSTAGNRKKFTISAWVKRANLSSGQDIIMQCGTESGGNQRAWFYFTGSDTLTFMFGNSASNSVGYEYYTDAVFRDPSAWYHVVAVIDTDNTNEYNNTAGTNRIEIYVNGEFQTLVRYRSAVPSGYANGRINSTIEHYIGRGYYAGYSDFYLANYTFLDGQALGPTNFGEYSDTLWKPKADSAIQALTFGTNGFYLPFKQTTEAEGFSAVNYIGNGSTNGIEGIGFKPDLLWIKSRNDTSHHNLYDSVRGLSAGTLMSSSANAEDSVQRIVSLNSSGFTTSPINYSYTNTSGYPYIAWAWDAGDNLAATGFTAVTYNGTGTKQSISGLGFEPDLLWIKNRIGGNSHYLYDSVRGINKGISSNSSGSEDTNSSQLAGFDADGFTVPDDSAGYNNYSGRKYIAWAWDAGTGSIVSNTNGTISSSVKVNTAKGFSIATYIGNATDGATIGHGLSQSPDMIIVKDRTNSAFWRVMHKDIDYTNDTLYLDADYGETADDRVKAFSSTTFTITGGGGVNGSGRNHVAYCFHGVSGFSKFGSYSGTGSAGNAITGLGFRPAFVMIKRKDAADNWVMFDNVRDPINSAEKYLLADSANAEATFSTVKIDFDSDGFTLQGSANNINNASGTYIYMAFAGGQDLVSPLNTNGTIDSRVKANTAKGFSIATYTGNGSSGATFGHGLGVTPDMVIVKRRDGANSWQVYTSILGATKFLELHSTGGEQTATNRWNDTAPSSSVVTLGDNSNVNSNGGTCVAYSFASITGYSKIGSYSGTGSSGNSITGLGFKPAFLMIKRTDTSSSWSMHDSTRNVNNPRNSSVWAESNSSEGTSSDYNINFDSDGFTINTSNAARNASGGSYIYMAFADTRNATFFGDTSGNGNNWTPNALNNTDVVPDSPVSGSNFAVMNPLDNIGTSNFSEGNLKVGSSTGSDQQKTRSTFSVSQNFYFEAYRVDGGTQNFNVGVATATADIGSTSNTGVYTKNYSGGAGDVLMFAYSATANALWTGINGTWDNSATVAEIEAGTTTNATHTSIADEPIAAVYIDQASSYSGRIIFNFGQDSSFASNSTPQGNTDDGGVGDFFFQPPSGYLALTTGNLPTPTITTPDEYFNTVLYTGNSTTGHAITGVGFQPDWTWIKLRNGASGHRLVDSVRGTTKYLDVSGTAAETTETDRVTSFDSDGFTLGNSATVNGGFNYVAWNWIAGGSSPSKTYTVKVVSDSGNKYRFDNFGTSAVTLDLQEGGTYVFDQSDSSNSGHPLRFSTTSDGTHGGGSEYTTGVTTTGTPGTAGASTTIVVAAGAPTLYYYCSVHSGMGGQSNTNSEFGSSNFAGDIQSRVSANTKSGFSIVSWTADGSTDNRVGHGLSSTPELIIYKERSAAGNWNLWTTEIDGTNDVLFWNLSAAGQNVSGSYTSPTATTISTYGYTSGNTMIAYCFHSVEGFSKIGSYTGNNSADGPFINTGFTPAWVQTKDFDRAAMVWGMFDNKRETFNVRENMMTTTTAAEPYSTTSDIDFLSNGFKFRDGSSSWNNYLTDTYFYWAFAEAPFSKANAK